MTLRRFFLPTWPWSGASTWDLF